eukprot:3931950-Ditylum_brightwellii.AAC.1
MFDLHRISTVPVTTGISGTIDKSFQNYVGQVSPDTHMDTIQKTAVLGTAHILRHILTDNIKH